MNSIHKVFTLMHAGNINILHTEWSCGWGGQEIRILNEMLALKKTGIQSFLACKKGSVLGQKAKNAGFDVFTLPFRNNVDLYTLTQLISLIKNHHIDIVNTHSGKDTWVGGLAAKLSGAKFIRTRHLSNPINPSRFNFINELADFVITTGESVKEAMIRDNRIVPDKIASIPTGVEMSRFDPKRFNKAASKAAFGLPQNAFVIGNLGVLRGFKRHDLLITSVVPLLEKLPELFLIIAGEGPQRASLEQLIADQPSAIASRIRLLGHTDQPERFLAALDLFVQSSDANEGVPQSVMQALAMGLPVIATDAGSTADLLAGENMHLVKAGSSEALREAIETLVDDPQSRERLACQARESIASRFSQEAMVEQLLAVYRKVLK